MTGLRVIWDREIDETGQAAGRLHRNARPIKYTVSVILIIKCTITVVGNG
jgi:hypothetical protein